MLTYKIKNGGHILLVPIEDVLPPIFSVRKVIPTDELTYLSESIKVNGVLVPITVKSNSDGTYTVISGERRRQAALMAELNFLPCILINVDDDEELINSFIDNTSRRKLHYLEIAEGIENIRNYMPLSEIATKLSVPEGLIYSRIRLLSLPDNVKWKLITSDIDESTANMICSLSDERMQNDVTDIIISSGVSFKDACELAGKSEKRSVFVAHYKNYRVFENTIEHAIETMKASGISVLSAKKEDSGEINYNITINKMI